MILAHGLGGRTDLPLPTWMVLYGGAMVLLISFAALAVLWPQPRWEGHPPGIPVLDSSSRPMRVLEWLGRAFGLVAFGVVLVAAVVGENDPAENIAPTAVYITFWVGLTFACGFGGNLWSVLNPFDTIALAMTPPGRRGRSGEGDKMAKGRIGRGGYWTAAAGLLGFVWLELVYPDRAQPRVLAVAIVAYSALVLFAVRRWGRSWLRHGEAFTALFRVLGHAAPFGRGCDGRLRVRPPFAGLSGLKPTPGLEWVVFVVLGSTTFDGLTRTQLWTGAAARYSGFASLALGTVGLLWSIAVVSIVYSGAMRVMSRITGGGRSPQELGLAFVHSLVPIALAYSVAHYFSLFVLEGQAMLALVSDPFGLGWNLFGTADRAVDYGLLGSSTIAYIQAGAVVVGHVAGVVVAHDRALALFDRSESTRSQYPLLGAMVLFTLGALLLLLGG